MPNIAITTYCNLHCPYCFANQMINTEDIKNISLDQFKKILYWITKDINIDQPKQQIGLIGGEPTLHPQFKEILFIVNKLSLEKNFSIILFTNGVYLADYIGYLSSSTSVLLNYNQPSAMNIDQQNKLQNTLNKLYSLGWLHNYQKVTLGCNLCPEIKDYSFFWEAVDKYKLHQVRMSITSPAFQYQNNKDMYYLNMINVLKDFLYNAEKRKVRIVRDCNQIPECYLDNNTIQLLNSISPNDKNLNPHCGPVIDITPDFQASACFGAYELVDCNLFNSFFELEYYLLHQIVIPKMKANNTGKCINCKKHQLLQCQGGCLAFAQH